MKLTIFAAAAVLLMTSVVMIQARSVKSQFGGILEYLKVSWYQCSISGVSLGVSWCRKDVVERFGLSMITVSPNSVISPFVMRGFVTRR